MSDPMFLCDAIHLARERCQEEKVPISILQAARGFWVYAEGKFAPSYLRNIAVMYFSTLSPAGVTLTWVENPCLIDGRVW